MGAPKPEEKCAQGALDGEAREARRLRHRGAGATPSAEMTLGGFTAP